MRKALFAAGFYLPEAKQSACWLDEDHLLVGSTLGEGRSTNSGYARSIRVWRRGQDLDQAKTVFTVAEDHMLAFAWIDRTASPMREIYGDQIGFFDVEAQFGDAEGPRQPIQIPKDCWWLVRDDHVVIKPRQSWTIAGHEYPRDTVLAGRLVDLLANRFEPVVLFEPKSRRTLKNMFWAGQRLILSSPRRSCPSLHSLSAGSAGLGPRRSRHGSAWWMPGASICAPRKPMVTSSSRPKIR